LLKPCQSKNDRSITAQILKIAGQECVAAIEPEEYIARPIGISGPCQKEIRNEGMIEIARIGSIRCNAFATTRLTAVMLSSQLRMFRPSNISL
jgi:hypothetical protein